MRVTSLILGWRFDLTRSEWEEVPMLVKQRCQHTGVVNFYTDADPFVSVASIVEAQPRNEFHWRWYSAKATIGGIASDMKTAESRVRSQYSGSAHTEV